MKHAIISVCFVSLFGFSGPGQPANSIHEPGVWYFENDSIVAFYNSEYRLAEDSCADIMRRAHYNKQTGKFVGAFEDVSKVDPRQTVAKGTYDSSGLKHGDFISWYLNGKLQARGNFRGNMFNGVWEIYYPSGKPKLTFEARGIDIKIIAAWNEHGRQRVVDGKGTYDFDAGSIWTGKIVDGKPDGSWVARRFHRYSQPGVLATEEFINGTFKRGRNATGVYDDSSRISFLSAVKLPFINAERFLWAAPCDTKPGYKVQFAYYPKGRKVFISEIRERLTRVLNLLDRATFITPLELHFTVLPNGSIEPAPTNISDSKLLSSLKDALRDLPNFSPATVNGKPVHQQLVITIKQVKKGYSFSYALSPFAVV